MIKVSMEFQGIQFAEGESLSIKYTIIKGKASMSSLVSKDLWILIIDYRWRNCVENPHEECLNRLEAHSTKQGGITSILEGS